jgi:transcriptional regulator with GAF, ATPase, and Fis domain
LRKEVEAGKFRMDLYYRLNVFPLAIPPLRERVEDIPLLVAHLLRKLSEKLGKTLHGVSSPTMDRFTSHSWPGNVRELENVLERAAILADGPVIEVNEPLAFEHRRHTPLAHAGTLEEVERAHILAVLEQTHWSVSGNRGAATILALNPSTLRSRMRKLGIRRPSSGK